MRAIASILLITFFILPASIIATSGDYQSIRSTQTVEPGEIITVSSSESYPTLGQPIYLLIQVAGNAEERFNETISITDEFSGFVMTSGEMTWTSGSLTIDHLNMTIGKLPWYIKKIPWYPSVAGNHTLRVTTAAASEKHLTLSVSFDTEGIITPSLGCPSLLTKDEDDQLQIMISEERALIDEPAQILKVELQGVDDSIVYPLDNQTMTWRTWIPTGSTSLEDELIISYDIDILPDGFYNITVTTVKNTYSWPHAVKILNIEPTEYTIVQLSDIHIGKYWNFVNKKKELIRLITHINANIHPDFIIISGDSVDWYNKRSKRNVYVDLQEALLYCDVPVFTTPGNHERFGNSLLFLYVPYTNLTPYHRFINPLSDYSLEYGNMNFIFLDSGYEYSRWEIQPQIWNPTPEGSGLSTTQMFLLEHVWGNNQINQIIIMHHPAVNDKNDTGLGALTNDLPSGNNECIVLNRAAFIMYCVTHNVSLVLSGHTHKNLVFTTLGKEPENDTAWPLFVQTDTATMSWQNNGGRIVHIKDNTVVSYEYLPFN